MFLWRRFVFLTETLCSEDKKGSSDSFGLSTVLPGLCGVKGPGDEGQAETKAKAFSVSHAGGAGGCCRKVLGQGLVSMTTAHSIQQSLILKCRVTSPAGRPATSGSAQGCLLTMMSTKLTLHRR
jgi:hypothetical protein